MNDKWLTVSLGILIGGFLVVTSVLLISVNPMNFKIFAHGEQNGPSVVLQKVDVNKVQESAHQRSTQEILQQEENTEVMNQESTEVVVTEEASYYIKVNRLASCITVYTTDEEGNYTVPVKAMACSVGLYGRTPIATTKISDKYVWRELYGGVYGQYAVRFNGHVLFHSVPYTSKSKSSLKSSAYNKLGEPASMGCVRLCVADAKWIYDNCDAGTVVEVYESEDPGPLGKPESIELDLESPNKGWDPTDPDPNNPWLTED